MKPPRNMTAAGEHAVKAGRIEFGREFVDWKRRAEVEIMLIVGAYSLLPPTYYRQSKRYYFFHKNGCVIRVPKGLLNEKITP